MCGGGGGKSQPATYTSADGKVFQDPNKAADRDRQLQLASALGFDRSGRLEDWTAALDPTLRGTYDQYNNQGLTAADYRAEQRLKEQEEQARQAEEQRKAGIAAGRSAVDTNLASFDDNYYGGISKSVLDYYLPQLDTQFEDANKNLTYNLARSGKLKSTSAGDQRAKLLGDYDLQRGNITNRAADAERAARENVSSAKSQLYNLADTSADPAAVNTQLAGETARLRSYAPELTPLGQLFGDYVTPVANFIGSGLASEAQGYRGFNTGLFNSGKNKSVNVVN